MPAVPAVEYPHVLRTRRLELRPLMPTDYAAWIEARESSGATGQVGAGAEVQDEKVPKQWFRALCTKHRKLWKSDRTYILMAFERSSGKHVGSLDVHIIERGNRQWANLGYAIHRSHRGLGLATEAALSVLRFAFGVLRLHRLEAVMNPDNSQSIRVAERLGMQFECVRAAFEREQGKWEDQQVYVAIQGRWQPPSVKGSPHAIP